MLARWALLPVLLVAGQQHNPALVVLDRACEHILGGGDCDQFTVMAEVQKQINKDDRLAHTSTVQMCSKVRSILSESEPKQESRSNREYCELIFERQSEGYYKFKHHAKNRVDL
jgi:hypothetical protein